MANISMPLIDEKMKARFWAKVAQRGEVECWPWTASKDARGYGRLAWWANGKTIPILATHISLLLDGRDRPIGAFALHSCDNPCCVNPAHLRWGTNLDNVADKIARGRMPPSEQHRATMRKVARRGANHRNARLSATQIQAIIMDQRIHREIAASYGISRGYIGEIKAGKKRVHG